MDSTRAMQGVVDMLQWLRQVVFALPRQLPVTWLNLNWTPVTVGVALAVMLGAWFLPFCGVRHWYHGKAHTVEDTTPVSCQIRPWLTCAPQHALPAPVSLGIICAWRRCVGDPAVTVFATMQRAPSQPSPRRLSLAARLPRLTLVNLVDEWMAQQPVGRARRSANFAGGRSAASNYRFSTG